MKPLLIDPPEQSGTCRSCGARIIWVSVAATGKRMPLNPPVHYVTRLDAFGVGAPLEVDRDRTTSHFATCPQAADWRRPR